jgi:hypothetical protein
LFNKNGYCIVENAISKDLASTATTYALIDERNNKTISDNSGMHSKYADMLTESILINMLPAVEENTGLSLYPTYSYYRVYRNGSVLPPHTDRESCEISATLCLGYSYNSEEISWPIFINHKGFVMEESDMIIYKGIELIHYREMLNVSEDVFHIQCFLHYVDKNGPYKDFAFDKRKEEIFWKHKR